MCTSPSAPGQALAPPPPGSGVGGVADLEAERPQSWRRRRRRRPPSWSPTLPRAEAFPPSVPFSQTPTNPSKFSQNGSKSNKKFMSFQSNCGYFLNSWLYTKLLVWHQYQNGPCQNDYWGGNAVYRKIPTEQAWQGLPSNGVYIVTDVTDISFLNKVGGKILKGSCQIRQSFFGQNLAWEICFM